MSGQQRAAGSDSDNSICFGDLIALHCKEREGDVGGYVIADKSSSAHNGVAVSVKDAQDLPNVSDINCIIFQVCVQNEYKLNKEWRKVQEQHNKNGLVDDDNMNVSPELSQAKSAANEEEKYNDLEQKRQTGKPLFYGQVIQLRHIFTNKYLHVNPMQKSCTEPDNMRIELKPCNAKTAWFRVTPGYKIKVEGETVQNGEQIILESLKNVGQFVHCSKDIYGKNTAYGERYELNLSVTSSGFIVMRYFKAESERRSMETSFLKGGSWLQLYHCELEAYLIAQNSLHAEGQQEVYFKVRSGPIRLYPSTSALTFWQIEKQQNILDGGYIMNGDEVRFRHATTKLYLTLTSCADADETQKVGLTDNRQDKSTVFRLHNILKSEKMIKFELYVGIEHVSSGYWLHGDSRSQSRAAVYEPSSRADKQIQVLITPHMKYDDAFTLQRIDDSLQKNANFAFGMVPVLKQLNTELEHPDSMEFRNAAEMFLQALGELKNFMQVDDMLINQRQKVLRSFMLVDIICRILNKDAKAKAKTKTNAKSSDKTVKRPQSGQTQKLLDQIVTECYQVLHVYLTGDDWKNKFYMFSHFDFFMKELAKENTSTAKNATQLVIEMLKDNIKFNREVNPEHVESFCKLAASEKNYRYIDILNVLCVCDGVSIPDNQNHIAEKYLQPLSQTSSDALFYLELGENINKQAKVVYISSDRRNWEKLAEFTAKNKTDHNEAYQYLEYQLELFTKLCQGRNDYTIDLIVTNLKLISNKIALQCLTDENIPERLRAKFCPIISDLFVNVGTNCVLDKHLQTQLTLVFAYRDIPLPDQARKPSSRSASILPDATHLEFVRELKDWILSYLEQKQVMVANNRNSSKLIEEVLKMTVTLVQGGYYANAEEIMKLLGTVLAMLDGRTDTNLSPQKAQTPTNDNGQIKRAEEEYRLFKRYEKSPETAALVEAKYQGLKIVDLFCNYVFDMRLEHFISLFKLIEQNGKDKTKRSPNFAQLLDEKFNHQKNPRFNKKVVKRLQELFEESDKNFLAPDFLEIMLDLCNYKYDRLITRSMSLLNRYFSAHEQLFSRSVQAMILTTSKSMTTLEIVRQSVITLKLGIATKSTDDSVDELVNVMNDLKSLCVLKDDKEEGHTINQNILYHQGVLTYVFDILAAQQYEQFPSVKAVRQAAIQLLKSFACQNTDIQQQLYDRLDVLLELQDVDNELAELLIEIFEGNKTLCMCLSAQQINQIVWLLEITKNSVLLYFFSAVMLVDNLPIKRNQSLVFNALRQYRTSIETVVDSDKQTREDLLKCSEENINKLEEKRYFCNVVQLLSFCAFGESRTVDSFCQGILSLNDLLDILLLDELCAGLRKPFVQFLVSVFMNSSSALAALDMKDFAHRSRLWKYFDKCAKELETIVPFLKKNPKEATRMLKRKPTRIHDTRDNIKHEIKETLHYFFDGLLPLISTFFKRFYMHNNQNPDPERQIFQVKTHEKLVQNLKSFADAVYPCLTDKNQRKLITKTLERASTEIQGPQHRIPSGGTMSLDTLSPARNAYNNDYKDEEMVNKKFYTFTNNVRKAYGGLNTVRAQIDFHSDEPYSTDNGSEDLPLGAEFQHFVNVFVEKDVGNKETNSNERKYANAAQLIKQLRISLEGGKIRGRWQQMEQIALDVKCFQVLRALLYNQIVKLPAGYDPGDGDAENSKQLEEIFSIQLAYIKFDVIKSVLPHIASPFDDVVREALAFMATLLYGGKQSVQKEILQHFLDSREATFFEAIKTRIELTATTIKEHRSLVTQYMNKVKDQKPFMKSTEQSTEPISVKGDAKDPKRKRVNQILQCLLPTCLQSKVGPDGTASSALVEGGLDHMSKSQNFNDKVTQDRTSRKKSMPKTATISVSAARLNANLDELEALLALKDHSYIQLVLRVLRMLCDGQFKPLQDYIREQKDNVRSIDLIAEVVKCLSRLYAFVNGKTIALTKQIFDMLHEVCLGNQTNQLLVFDYKIVSYVNFLLQTDSTGCDLKDVLQLKKSIAELLRAMTEEFSDQGQTKAILRAVSNEGLVRTMTGCYKKAKDGNDIDEDVKNLLYDVGFAYYHLLMRAIDFEDEESRPSIDSRLPRFKEAQQFYTENSLSVEIQKDGTLHRIYFRVKDKNVLHHAIMDKIRWEVDRSSSANKLHDFMQWVRAVRYDVQYQKKVQGFLIGRVLSHLVGIWRPLNILLLLLTYAINICILVFWEAPEVTDSTYTFSVNNGSWRNVHYMDAFQIAWRVLGVAHNICSFLILVSFISSSQPRLPQLKFRNPFKQQERKNRDQTERTYRLRNNLFGLTTLYYCLFFAMSILGTCWNASLFAFHVFEIAAYDQLLGRVIKGLSINGKSLLMVSFLGILMFYLFALFGFFFLRDVYTDNKHHCLTVFQCFLTVIREGLVFGLGQRIDSSDSPGNNTFEYYRFKIIYDVAFYVLISTLFMNIIMGFIVDTFSELRDKKCQIEKDMNTTCFICSRDAYEFEHQGQDFKYHVTQEHSMCAYLFFFINLFDKPENTMSSLELYVHRQMKERKNDFFPLGHAISLTCPAKNRTAVWSSSPATSAPSTQNCPPMYV